MEKVDCRSVRDNPIYEFEVHNALVSARKNDGSFNMCTIGWGTIGELWSKDVCIVYVKPIRYTDEFIDEDDYFVVTFFEDSYKKDLITCGVKSGRDIDKVKATNLKPIELEHGISFEGYTRIYICKKIYKGQFKKENFIDSKDIIEKFYKDEECHNMYVGEIVETIEK